jgi:hypothetical protein
MTFRLVLIVLLVAATAAQAAPAPLPKSQRGERPRGALLVEMKIDGVEIRRIAYVGGGLWDFTISMEGAWGQRHEATHRVRPAGNDLPSALRAFRARMHEWWRENLESIQ